MNRCKIVPFISLKNVLLAFAILFSLIFVILKSSPIYSAEVTLAWDKNIETDLAGYKLYYKIDTPGAPYEGTGADQGDSEILLSLGSLSDPNNPEYTLTGLLDDKDYYFVVTAYDTEDNESDYSNEVCLDSAEEPPDEEPPDEDPPAEDPPDEDPPNNEPIAQNNSIETDEDNAIAVTLTATDEDNDTLSYTIVSNPNQGILSGTAPNLTYTPDEDYYGEDSFTFKANDGKDDSNIATVTITINSINDAPIADAGQTQTVSAGALVTLNGTGSTDIDDGIASYLWELIEDIPITISDPTASSTTFIAPDLIENDVSYTFQLTVKDNGGLTSTDTCIVNINSENAYPIADAGPDQTVFEGDEVILDASNSIDTDDGIASYKWEKLSGIEITTTDPNDFQVTFIAPSVESGGESILFKLTVYDKSGNESTDTCIINIILENNPPIANAGEDQNVNEGNNVYLDGTQSNDPDDDIITYLWEQVSGSEVSISNPASSQTFFLSPYVDSEGEALIFELTATDSDGLQSSDKVIINICSTNQAPVANAGVDLTIIEGTTVNLNGGNSSDPDGSILLYKWTQIEGSPVILSDSSAIDPYFVAPPVDIDEADLIFQLTVEDSGGLKNSDEVSITVQDNGITDFPEDVITFISIADKSMGIKIDKGGNLIYLNTSDLLNSSDLAIEIEDLIIFGLMELEIKVQDPGDSVNAIFYLPEPMEDTFELYYYDANNTWNVYSEQISFNENNDQATITLTDGGIGDKDGVENGVIAYYLTGQIEPLGTTDYVTSTEKTEDEEADEEITVQTSGDETQEIIEPDDESQEKEAAAGCFISTVLGLL